MFFFFTYVALTRQMSPTHRAEGNVRLELTKIHGGSSKALYVPWSRSRQVETVLRLQQTWTSTSLAIWSASGTWRAVEPGHGPWSDCESPITRHPQALDLSLT